VGQRLLEQGVIPESVPNLGFKRVEVVRCHTRDSRAPANDDQRSTGDLDSSAA
jgi:hypothetical protein